MIELISLFGYDFAPILITIPENVEYFSSLVKYNLPCLPTSLIYGLNTFEYFSCIREQCLFNNDIETGAEYCINKVP